jgi:hypothetical protein
VPLKLPTIGKRCHWLCPSLVSGVIDTAHNCSSAANFFKLYLHIWAVVEDVGKKSFGQQCHWHRPQLISGVIAIGHQRSAVSLTPLTSKSGFSNKIAPLLEKSVLLKGRF